MLTYSYLHSFLNHWRRSSKIKRRERRRTASAALEHLESRSAPGDITGIGSLFLVEFGEIPTLELAAGYFPQSNLRQSHIPPRSIDLAMPVPSEESLGSGIEVVDATPVSPMAAVPAEHAGQVGSFAATGVSQGESTSEVSGFGFQMEFVNAGLPDVNPTVSNGVASTISHGANVNVFVGSSANTVEPIGSISQSEAAGEGGGDGGNVAVALSSGATGAVTSRSGDNSIDVSVGDVVVREGEDGSVVLQASEVVSRDTSVRYRIAAGSAGRHDLELGRGQVIIAAGEDNAEITVSTNTDNAIEGTETFSIELLGGRGLRVVDGIGRGLILDGETNDGAIIGTPPPGFDSGQSRLGGSGATPQSSSPGSVAGPSGMSAFAADPYSIDVVLQSVGITELSEGGPTGEAQVELSLPVAYDVTVDLESYGSPNSPAATYGKNGDYDFPTEVVIPKGQTSTTFNITINDDAIVDQVSGDDEHFGIEIVSVTDSAAPNSEYNYSVIEPLELFTISDNDIAGSNVSYVVESVQFAEDGQYHNVKVTRTGDLSGSSTGSLTASDITTNSADFSLVDSSVTFGPSVSVAYFRVHIKSDTHPEDTEQFKVEVIGSPASAGIISILDDDQTFELLNHDFDEDDGSKTLSVTRNGGDLSESLTVALALQANRGSATSGDDFTFSNGSVTFGPNETLTTYPVTIVDDLVVEGDEPESFYIKGTATIGGVTKEDTGVYRISDNDESLGAPPSFTGSGTITVVCGATGTLDIALSVSDPDGDPSLVTLSKSGQPETSDGGIAPFDSSAYSITGHTLHIDKSKLEGASSDTYKIPLKATDAEGYTDYDYVDVVVVNQIAPPAAPTITSPGQNINFLESADNGVKDLDVVWSGDSSTESYSWKLFELQPNGDGTFDNNDWVEIDSGGGTGTTYGGPGGNGFEAGVYAFEVVANGCSTSSDPTVEYFAVAQVTFENPTGNNETQCPVCSCTCGMFPGLWGFSVPGFNGNVMYDVGEAMMEGINPALRDFASISVASNADPLPVTYTKWELGGAKNIEIDQEASAPFTDGIQRQVLIDEAMTDNGPAVIWAPVQFEASGGTYGWSTASIDTEASVTLPALDGGADVVVESQPWAIDVAAPVNNLANSPYGRRGAIRGITYIDVEEGEDPVLYRGDMSHVIYQPNGTGWDTPLGSYSDLAEITGGYMVTSAVGRIDYYDSSGRLEEIVEPDGTNILVDYALTDLNGDGLINEVASVTYAATGESLIYSYDASGRLDTITHSLVDTDTADDRTWTFEYEPTDNLLDKVIGPDPADPAKPQQVIDFEYKAGGTRQLEAVVTTDNGTTPTVHQKVSLTYDKWMNVTSITSEGDPSTTADDQAWGIKSAESSLLDGDRLWTGPIQSGDITEGPSDVTTLNNGETIERSVDTFGKTLRESRQFNNAGVDQVQITEYARNPMGQVTKMVGPYIEGDANPPVYDYVYDSLSRLGSVSFPDGTSESWTFVGLLNGEERGPHQPDSYTDRMGSKTIYGYDTNGLLDEVKVYSDVSPTVVVDHTTMEYIDIDDDVNAEVWQLKIEKQHIGFNGQTTGDDRPATHYYYDDLGRVSHIRYTTFAADYGNPSATQSTDLWESIGYDDFGFVEWTTSLYATSTFTNGVPTYPDDTLRTNYVNDIRGNVTEVKLPDPDGPGINSQERPVYTYTYDSAQRLKTSATPRSSTQSVDDVTTTYNYDELGRLFEVVSPDPDGTGTALTASTTRTYYDALGYPAYVETVDANDAVQTSQRMEYNSLGLVSWQSQPYLGEAPQSISVQDRTWYRYDGMGRIGAVWEPGGYAYRDVDYQYDDETNTVMAIDALGHTWTMQYDALGRVKSETTPDPDGPNAAIVTSYTYEPGHTGFATATGNAMTGTLVTMSIQSGTESRADVRSLINTFGQTLVTELGDPDGNQAGSLENAYTVNQFDKVGNLTSSSELMGASLSAAYLDPDGRTTDYEFNDRGQLTERKAPDPDGTGPLPRLFTEYDYDHLGRVVSEVSLRPEGTAANLYAESKFDYYPNGLLQKQTFFDRDAYTDNDWYVEYEYDNLDRQILMQTPVADADSTSRADTTYEYNQLGLLYRELLPEPTAGAGRPTTEYVYDSLTPGQPDGPGIYLTEVKAPSGLGTGTTKYEYDSAGRMTAEYRPDPVSGSPSSGAFQKWEYDALGRVEKHSMLRSSASAYNYDVVDYQYDALGRIKSEGLLTNRNVYEYDAFGNVNEMTDPLGRVTEYDYDDWGRPVEERRLLGASVNDTTVTAYDSLGRIESTTLTDGTTSLTTSYEYDAMDRQTKITGPSGDYQDFKYRQWGPLERYRNEYLQPTYYLHDAAGRLIEVDEVNDQNKVTYKYNAFGSVKEETRVLDGANTATYSYDYDNLGRLVEETLPAIGATADSTLYDYDLAGNLTSLTDPVGNETTWEYDHRNRKTLEKITVVNGGVSSTYDRTWTYFVNDNLNWYKDRNDAYLGFDYEYVFGAGHRVYREKWWDSGYAGGVTYDFDSTGLLTEEIKTHDPEASGYIGPVVTNLKYSHDGLGRVTNTRDYLTGNSDDDIWQAVDVASGYDAFDRRTSSSVKFTEVQTIGGSQKHRWNSTVYTTWNADSEVESVTQYRPVTGTETGAGTNDQNSRRRVDLTYFANGDLKTLTRTEGFGATLSDSLVSTYTLADNGWHQGRVGSIVHSGMTGSVTSETYSWTYQDGGRVDTFTTPVGSRTYQYDDLGQLTDVVGTGAQSQDYDSNGNRTESSHTVIDHNRLTEDASYLYQYDAEGRRTRRTLKSDDSFEVYEWSIRGLLTSVTRYAHQQSGTNYLSKVEYDYDGTNRRIRRTVDVKGSNPYQTQQRFVYDTNVLDDSFNEVVLILDEEQSWDAGTDTFDPAVDALFMNGPMLDQVFSHEDASGEIYWNLQDNQQTVRDVARFTNLDGDVPHEAELLNQIEYDAFGKITAETDGAYTPMQSYTGQILDELTGLIYYDARWFDPVVNQFVSEDPMGFNAGDTNLKRYVGNRNPNSSDPSGLYDEAGHFFTTYVIARIVGFTADEALELAYYSQLPDEIARHDAVHNVIVTFPRGLTIQAEAAVAVFFSEQKAVDCLRRGERDQKFARVVVNQTLHSLHGGGPAQVKAHRSAIANLIMRGTDDLGEDLELSDLGYLIHSFADAYAHTYTAEKSLISRIAGGSGTGLQPRFNAPRFAFGWPHGHAGSLDGGHAVDIIPYDYFNYHNYTNALARVLQQRLSLMNDRTPHSAEFINRELFRFNSAVTTCVTGKRGDKGELARQQMYKLVKGEDSRFSFSDPDFNYTDDYNPLGGQNTSSKFGEIDNNHLIWIAYQITTERFGVDSKQADIMRGILFSGLE